MFSRRCRAVCVLNPQALCAQAFRNDTGRCNGAEQTISLANRVTSLSDKFVVPQPKAIKRSEALCAHGWFPEEFMLLCSVLVYSRLQARCRNDKTKLLSGLLSSNTTLSALFIAHVLLFADEVEFQ